MLPHVVDHRLVNQFKYWHNGIQLGMRYGADLYAHVRSYPRQERLQAYDLSCELADRGIETCITCSGSQYDVWISLKASPLAKNLSRYQLPAASSRYPVAV